MGDPMIAEYAEDIVHTLQEHSLIMDEDVDDMIAFIRTC